MIGTLRIAIMLSLVMMQRTGIEKLAHCCFEMVSEEEESLSHSTSMKLLAVQVYPSAAQLTELFATEHGEMAKKSRRSYR